MSKSDAHVVLVAVCPSKRGNRRFFLICNEELLHVCQSLVLHVGKDGNLVEDFLHSLFLFVKYHQTASCAFLTLKQISSFQHFPPKVVTALCCHLQNLCQTFMLIFFVIHGKLITYYLILSLAALVHQFVFNL